MSNALTLKRGDRLNSLTVELRELGRSATQHFFRMGEIMKEVRDKELWRNAYESFGAYYADPELDYAKSSVYHAIKLVEMFPDWKEITDVPVGKLILIAPKIDDSNRDELISQARVLSKSDLQHQLVVMNLATHESTRSYSLPKVYPCVTCGKAKGISYGDLCHCGMPPDHAKRIGKFIDNLNSGNSFNREGEEDIDID